MSPEELFALFTSKIPKDQLDEGLASKVLETLKIGVKGDEVTDIVPEEISKYVEVQLKSTYEEFTHETLSQGGNFGLRLVDALRDAGLIQEQDGETEPVYHLLRWYFGERNTPHHQYATYDAEQFLSYWQISNRILFDFRKRKEELPRAIAMSIDLNPTECKVGSFFNVTTQIVSPYGELVDTGSVTAEATFHNKSQLKVQLVFSSSDERWSGRMSTSGATLGNFDVRIFSFGEEDRFVSKSPARGKIVIGQPGKIILSDA